MDKASYIFEVEAELDDGLDVAGDKIGHLALGPEEMAEWGVIYGEEKVQSTEYANLGWMSRNTPH